MAHLIHIGNSLGVRIPKATITQVGFKIDTDLDFKVTEEGLLITPKRQCREGWAEAYDAAGKSEELLMGESIENQFDECEWKW